MNDNRNITKQNFSDNPVPIPNIRDESRILKQDNMVLHMTPFLSPKIMKFSIICFSITFILGLVSMGLFGQGLYYLVSPILNLKFPPMSSWHGDWVWPVSFMSGMFWSFGFLIGGWIYSLLKKFGWPRIALYCIYIFILFIWDLFVWFMILNVQPANSLI